jgi:hypothetical protein
MTEVKAHVCHAGCEAIGKMYNNVITTYTFKEGITL